MHDVLSRTNPFNFVPSGICECFLDSLFGVQLHGRWVTLEHALVLILGPLGFCRSANLLLALTAPFGA